MDLDEVAQFIRANAGGYDSRSVDAWLSHSTLARYRDWVPPPASGESTIMDIGCYEPSLGYYSALGWQDIVGIFKEENEIARSGSSRFAEKRVQMVRLDVEVEAIPRESNSVDVVLMMEILEHFELDPMHALTEVNRVLKPGRLLVLSTPNATSLDCVYRVIRGLEPHTGLEFSGFSTNRHNRIYDCSEIVALLQAAGFEVQLMTSRTYDAPPPPLKARLLSVVLRVSDAYLRRRDGRPVERGQFLFARARKRRPPSQRFPRHFYFDRGVWADWFKSNSPHFNGNGVCQ